MEPGRSGRFTGFFPRLLLTVSCFACGGGVGDEGSQIPIAFEDLAGGIVFASRAFEGSNGYDLYWAPVPAVVTLDAQPVLRLTETGGNEWQPSSSPGGHGIAFVREDEGIFFIDREGVVRRISDPRDTNFADSNPAVSWDGTRVAWEREDRSRPIGNSGFSETFIMLANADGSDARPLSPLAGVVQTAPKFEPTRSGTRVVFSEFGATNIGVNGPVDYGIRWFDYETGTDNYLCRSQIVVIGEIGFRCFGLHLAWPTPNAVVIPQNFLELYLDGAEESTSYGPLVDSITSQNIGAPYLNRPGVFFAPFPLSASYQNLDRMIVDGVVSSVEGNIDTLAFFIANVNGTNARRLNLRGYLTDLDPENTGGYLFSLATPQFILPRQE